MPLKRYAAVMCLLLAVPGAPAVAGEPAVEAKFVTRSARQPLCDALAAWSLQTGQTYCYSAALPGGPVVADEPGREVSLGDVLGELGWRMAVNVAQPPSAVIAVVRAGDEEKVAALRKTLLESPDESARRTAAYALGRLTVPAAVAALAEGIADKSPAVGFQCLEALWAIESDFGLRQLPGRVSLFKAARINAEPLAALAASAADDKPRRAWRYSVALLGRAQSPLVRPLALAGQEDPDPRVRDVALAALRHVQGAGDAAKEGEPAAALLTSGGPNSAVEAADVLGRFGRPEAERALVNALGATEDWRRVAAANGLAVPAKQRSAKAVDALIALRKDDSPAVRAAAVRASSPPRGLAKRFLISRRTRTRRSAWRRSGRSSGPAGPPPWRGCTNWLRTRTTR